MRRIESAKTKSRVRGTRGRPILGQASIRTEERTSHMHSLVNRPRALLLALATALVFAAAAEAAVAPPPAIKSAGKIVFCSDITYPPEESYQGTKAVGSDIDFGTAI